MKIHNSHSRKELFDVIAVFELPIPNRNEYNKSQIQIKIIECLEYFDKINPDLEYFFIENKEDLIKYLEYPNPHKTLTIKEKDEVMSKSKRIIGYCRNQIKKKKKLKQSQVPLYIKRGHFVISFD